MDGSASPSLHRKRRQPAACPGAVKELRGRGARFTSSDTGTSVLAESACSAQSWVTWWDTAVPEGGGPCRTSQDWRPSPLRSSASSPWSPGPAWSLYLSHTQKTHSITGRRMQVYSTYGSNIHMSKATWCPTEILPLHLDLKKVWDVFLNDYTLTNQGIIFLFIVDIFLSQSKKKKQFKQLALLKSIIQRKNSELVKSVKRDCKEEETEKPWASSSCLRVSPSAENRSSLMRVSALRLHSRCCAFSCMAVRVDSSMSVSFSTRWYFPRACVHTGHKTWDRVGPSSTKSNPSDFPVHLVPLQVFPHAQVYSLGDAKRTQAHWWWSGQPFKKHGTCSYSRDPPGRIPSGCPLWTVSARSSAMFLWKTWLSCRHASWEIRHQNEIKDHKVPQQQQQRQPHSNTADWWGEILSLRGTKQNICKNTIKPISCFIVFHRSTNTQK